MLEWLVVHNQVLLMKSVSTFPLGLLIVPGLVGRSEYNVFSPVSIKIVMIVVGIATH